MRRTLAAVTVPMVTSIGIVALPDLTRSGVEAKNPQDCGAQSVGVRQDEQRCVVQFGLAGEPWDPAAGGGGVTRDRNVPDLITVRSGTTVDFENIGAPHRISIYNHGINSVVGGVLETNNRTTLVDVTGSVVTNVIQANAVAGQTLVGPLASGASTSYTFSEPGQYLVICSFNPHFRNFAQATFVIVDDAVN